jgi:hypothetical protein
MVPGWGDGVHLGVIGGKASIKIPAKAAVRMGEVGIATGLKKVKAASKVEKAATETAGGGAKVGKTEKEAAEEAFKARRGRRGSRKEEGREVDLLRAQCGDTDPKRAPQAQVPAGRSVLAWP